MGGCKFVKYNGIIQLFSRGSRGRGEGASFLKHNALKEEYNFWCCMHPHALIQINIKMLAYFLIKSKSANVFIHNLIIGIMLLCVDV